MKHFKMDDKRPQEGEIYRNNKGAIRQIRGVDEGERYVYYSRPAPANPEWTAVSLLKWLEWADRTEAKLIRKASVIDAKDNGYITEVVKR